MIVIADIQINRAGSYTKGQWRAGILQFPPFRLDTADQCLWRQTGAADERVSLTPKAFAVLRYLVEHAGRLVTQDEFLNALWPNTFVQPEVLKYQIADIRRILEDNAKNPRFIETLPRRGYRFVAAVTDVWPGESPSETPRQHGTLTEGERELDELRSCLRKALNGQRQIVFITEEPGIGKSSLVDQLQRTAGDKEPELQAGYLPDGLAELIHALYREVLYRGQTPVRACSARSHP